MNYNFIFIWLFIVAILINIAHGSFIIDENGYMQRQTKWLWAVVAFIPIFYLAVFGAPQGDVAVYIENYKTLPEKWTDILLYIKNLDSSYLFWLLAALIKKISGTNVLAFRFIIALIQSIPVIYVFRKYSDNYLLSLYIFVASAVPLAWMMNGLRQFAAVTIIFGATPFIIKKDYKKVIPIILIASLFHQTAIIMLPIVFIAQGKAWNKKTIFLIIAAIFAVYLFANNSGAYESFMEGAGYSSEVYATDDGTNPLRVLVNFIPVALAFLGKKSIEKDNIPIINFSINMSIISFGIYLVSMVTSGILVGRVPIYMSLYSLLLFPYLIKRIFTFESYRIMKIILIVCYGFYYFIQYA